MSAFFGPILAAALVGQFQGGTLQGTVVDDQGKPVPGAQVVLHAPAPWGGKVEPVEARATTDAEGRYRLITPSLRGVYLLRARIWAFRPGLAFAALQELPGALALHKPAPKTVKIEGPDGRAVAGARVSPRVISFGDGSTPADMPDSLAEPRTVTTGPDGTATLDYLAAGHQLVAVRVAAESIGTQDFPLIERPGRDVQGATITIRLATSRLAGRVRTRAGAPVAGQTIEVWFKGSYSLESNPVGFQNGPVVTAADGSFQTPDNLLVGSPYRVAVLAPGMEPILSDWITIGEKPRVLLPMLQRPLRTISGRVVDRQGKSVANIEVFQSGDGPTRTNTKTDADGRFTLGGFCQGPVFLFARGEGFRFFGRLIKPGDADVTVELTRTSERPAREMRMLADRIPLEESRALARRLLEPFWKAIDEKNAAAKIPALSRLVLEDPIGVLQRLDGIKFPNPRGKRIMQTRVVLALARSDPAEAETVAEAIEEPGDHASALVAVFDALPDQERKHKLALLDRAALQAKAATALPMRVRQMAEVAKRWYELGEKERAKTLLSDALRVANTATRKGTPVRAILAVPLARVDLPSALAIAKEFPATGIDSEASLLANIAFHLAAENPAQAERVLSLMPQDAGRDRFPPAIAWKMAAVDPARARRLTDQSQRDLDYPQRYLFLALGLKPRDPAAASQAFQTGMQGIDRLMKEEVEYSSKLGERRVLLPMVEQIDPALVPEYFWRVVATRHPAGNPRSGSEVSSAWLTLLLAWYDRDVAAAVFEPVRARLEHADDRELAGSAVVLQAWSILDPRAAAAWLEQVPVNPNLDLDAGSARRRVSELLGLPHEARWRNVWINYSYMADILVRDL